jgi:hypothetical protein
VTGDKPCTAMREPRACCAFALRESERARRNAGPQPEWTMRRRAGRDVSSWRVCGRRACRTSCGPRGAAGNNPCSRQGDPVVASGSTGRRLLVEDDHWRLRQDADVGQPDGVAAASAAGRPLTGAHARMDVPLREGSAGPRSGRSRDVRARAPVCARFRPRLRSSARARTARPRVVPSERLRLVERTRSHPRKHQSRYQLPKPPCLGGEARNARHRLPTRSGWRSGTDA